MPLVPMAMLLGFAHFLTLGKLNIKTGFLIFFFDMPFLKCSWVLPMWLNWSSFPNFIVVQYPVVWIHSSLFFCATAVHIWVVSSFLLLKKFCYKLSFVSLSTLKKKNWVIFKFINNVKRFFQKNVLYRPTNRPSILVIHTFTRIWYCLTFNFFNLNKLIWGLIIIALTTN